MWHPDGPHTWEVTKVWKPKKGVVVVGWFGRSREPGMPWVLATQELGTDSCCTEDFKGKKGVSSVEEASKKWFWVHLRDSGASLGAKNYDIGQNWIIICIRGFFMKWVVLCSLITYLHILLVFISMSSSEFSFFLSEPSGKFHEWKRNLESVMKWL